MPKAPASAAQLRFVHAEANRGTPWAKRTVKEWHGKHFGHLPARRERLKGHMTELARRRGGDGDE